MPIYKRNSIRVLYKPGAGGEGGREGGRERERERKGEGEGE